MGNENLPTSLGNPGDLKEPGIPGATQTPSGLTNFSSTPGGAVEGYTYLLNDVQTAMNKKPNETLEQFSDTYAPADDGNNPMQYATALANKLDVPPTTSIGSLEPRITSFADAISQEEGYSPQGQSGISGIGAPVAAGGVALGAGAIGAGLLSLPEDALAGAADVGKGLLSKIGLGGLFGGGSSSNQSTPSEASPSTSTPPVTLPPGQQAPETGTPPTPPPPIPPETPVASGAQPSEPQGTSGVISAPPANPYATPENPSSLYNSISNMAGMTVGGRDVMQEGVGRGIDPVVAAEMSGVISAIQPDKNGDIDREAGVDYQNGKIAEDKTSQRKMVATMTTSANVEDLRHKALKYVKRKMADTGESEAGMRAVNSYFDDVAANLPRGTKPNGESYIKSFSISPFTLQKKKEQLTAKKGDFSRPQHERSARAHIKEVMRKELSEIAKKEGIKGWDETNKRMEANILVRKLVEKLPKKAQRDVGKELRKEILGALSGAAVGKLLGQNTLLGGLVGGVIERRLGRPSYKNIGTPEELKAAAQKGKTPQRGLLSRA